MQCGPMRTQVLVGGNQKISPLKRAIEIYKPRGLFWEFYGITDVKLCHIVSAYYHRVIS